MKLLERMAEEGRATDLKYLLTQIPYTQHFGFEVTQQGDEIVTSVRFQEQLVGNVNLPAIHGGAIGAMLETTAILQLLHVEACTRLPRTISFAIDYLRSAGDRTTYGRAIVTRRGRRVAHVRSELWQERRDKPVAVSHGHYMMTPLQHDA